MSERSQVSLYGVYGAGGCGRGVLPVAEKMLVSRGVVDPYELVFIDDEPEARDVNGRRVLTLDEFAEAPATARRVSIAVADPTLRAQLAERCADKQLDCYSIIAPNAEIMDDTRIGQGAILSPFVTITSNVRIGRHFQANLYSYVEHDCRIGDYVTFAPRVCCNGNVVIEDGAYLGAGCILRQGKPGEPLVIGERAVVGMGAVVTKNVPAGVTVAGNPARLLQKA